jgi:hypothetical protein
VRRVGSDEALSVTGRLVMAFHPRIFAREVNSQTVGVSGFGYVVRHAPELLRA